MGMVLMAFLCEKDFLMGKYSNDVKNRTNRTSYRTNEENYHANGEDYRTNPPLINEILANCSLA